MTHSFRRILSAAAAFVIGLMMSVTCAAGAGAAAPQYIELSVAQTFVTNSASASGVFTYQLMGDGEEPMPAGSSAGAYVFTMDGTTDITLPKIVFNTVGVYEYELSGVKSDDAFYAYDNQVYTIDIYVTNDTSTPTVLIYLDDGSSAGDKAPVISFTETYQAPAEPTPTPGPSVQTGGMPADGNDSELLLIACLLAVSGAGAIVLLARIRSDVEEDPAQEAGPVA